MPFNLQCIIAGHKWIKDKTPFYDLVCLRCGKTRNVIKSVIKNE